MYRGKYFSSLKMTWLWGPLVSPMTGSVRIVGLNDCGVHTAKSLETPHRDMTSGNETASRPLRKRSVLSENPGGCPSPHFTLVSYPFSL